MTNPLQRTILLGVYFYLMLTIVRNFARKEWLIFVGLLYITKWSLEFVLTTVDQFRSYILPNLQLPPNLLEKFGGEWAVVTGSTDGIGKAYAEQLAKRGVNIVLISRNQEKLKRVAHEIETEYKVKTKIIITDFSVGRPVYEKLRQELDSLEVGILINNVGFLVPYPKFVAELTDDEIWNIINVNIGATTMMTRIILPQMKKRRKGAIVNVSSTSEYIPVPLLSAYGASKVYVRNFTEALRYEVEGYGIFVQKLVPHYVATNMTQFSEYLRKANFFVPSPTAYSRAAVNTLGKATDIAGYWIHDLMNWVVSASPVITAMLCAHFSLTFLRRDYLLSLKSK